MVYSVFIICTPCFPLLYASFQGTYKGYPCLSSFFLRSLMYFFVPPFSSSFHFWKSASCGFDHECKTIVYVHSCKGVGKMSVMAVMKWILLFFEQKMGEGLSFWLSSWLHCLYFVIVKADTHIPAGLDPVNHTKEPHPHKGLLLLLSPPSPFLPLPPY